MTKSAKKILSALKQVFLTRRGILTFALGSFAIAALFVMIPVWTTPGNDILFQLSIMKAETYAIMVPLALLNGLVIAMQLHIRANGKASAAATGFAGALAASFFATIGCAACYSSVLALFGLGGTIFIVEHRLLFALSAAALSLLAIAKSAQRIEEGCDTACHL